jgi:very-short-patch-repair endonuclease
MTDDRRRDRMAARQGWVVLRFTWEDVTERPDEIADTVAVVLAARRNIASQPK